MNRVTHKIGLGTAAIGRPHYINIRKEKTDFDSLEAFKQRGMTILDEAYQRGIRYFDTAPGYGMAEDLLFNWATKRKYEDIEIATKWGYTYMANFQANADLHEVKEHSLQKLNEQWANSRELLPWLSSYQIHSATLESGVLSNKEVLHRLNELKNTHNLIIGLTTSGANQSEIIRKSAEIEFDGKPLFDLFQVTYNILEQSLSPTLDQLISEGKRIVIKEAMANGRIFPNKDYPLYSKLYGFLTKLSNKYKLGVDAIALRYCIQSVSPFSVLSGASSLDQLIENLKVNEFELRKEDILLLREFSVEPEFYWHERKQLNWN